MRPRTFMSRIAAAFVLACFCALPARGADRSLEYAVKSTFLYKFASFVDWPAGTFAHESSPFILCVAGTDPYGGRIRTSVAGQNVAKRPIVLRQLTRTKPRSGCHAMFVSGSNSQTIAEALDAVSGSPILTITDATLGRAPGIIHFVIVDDRVSFDIDMVAAVRNRIVISSKLLELANKVNRPGPNP